MPCNVIPSEYWVLSSDSNNGKVIMASPKTKQIQARKHVDSQASLVWVSTTLSEDGKGNLVQTKGQTYVKSEHGKL